MFSPNNPSTPTSATKELSINTNFVSRGIFLETCIQIQYSLNLKTHDILHLLSYRNKKLNIKTVFEELLPSIG